MSVNREIRMTTRQIGFLAMIFSVSGYALLPILTRAIYQVSDLQPTDLAIWRFVFATPAIWLAIAMREKVSKTKRLKRDEPRQILIMLSLGLLYAGAALSVFFGLQYIQASLYVVLFYTYPTIVALISVMLGQRLPWLSWLAIALTLGGVILTVPDLRFAGENTALGLMIALMNAVFVAVYFVIVSRQMPKMSSVSRGAAYVITGTLLILILFIPVFGLNMPSTPLAWSLLLVMALWSTAMPIFVINIGIQKLGVTQASIISTSEPILTMVLALVLLNEIILPIQWVGAILIISGVLLLELRFKRK
ncbi:MAG: DMT family transporter [Anaerolineae bacterium]